MLGDALNIYRHKTLGQYCFNVGPPSKALDQRKANID